MELQPVLVTDTSIWIDLENGGILNEVFELPHQFLVPDFAIGELSHPRWETLAALGLAAYELPGEQVLELFQLRLIYRNLSVVDLSAYLLARLLDAVLLTGDRRLTALSTNGGVTVHGVLWLLDELVHIKILTPMQGAVALNRMLESGARLPAEECETRILDWSA